MPKITYYPTISSKASTLTQQLFDQLTNSPGVAETCAAIEACADDEQRGALKRRLPAVTWQAWWPDGSRRQAATAIPTGLFMLDYDHYEHPAELWQNIAEKLPGSPWKDRVMLAHITPSGHGLRLVVRRDSRFDDIAANQAAFVAETLCCDYDMVAKDMARLSFIVPSKNFLFINPQIFNEDEEQETIIRDGQSEERGQESAPRKDSESSHSGADNADQPAGSQVADKKEPFGRESKFKGISYGSIVDAQVKKMGGDPVVGERNTFLYRLARKLRYIVDFDKAKLVAILPSFGLDASELRSLAESACKGSRTGKIPYDLWQTIQDLQGGLFDGDEAVEAEPAEPTDFIPLPPVFQDFVNIAPTGFRAATVMALLPVMGTLMSRLRSTYLDGEVHAPNFMTVIEAPQASGKSFTRRIYNQCLASVIAHDRANVTKEQAYLQLLKTMRNAKEQPEEPVCIIRNIPASVSIAKLLKRLDHAQGLHLFSFCEEIDTLTKSNRSGAWAQKTDIYRNAYDNAVYGQDYMSENSYSAMVQVYYNLLLCGTPNAVNRFFNDPEDGLISRILFCTLPSQFGCRMPVWKTMNSLVSKKVSAICRKLDEELGLSTDDTIAPEHHVDLPFLNKAISKWLEKQLVLSVKEDSSARDIFRRRCAVNGFRAGMIAFYLYGEKRDAKTRRLITTFAEWVAEESLRVLMYKYDAKMDEIRMAQKVPRTACYNLYDRLPQRFQIADLHELLAETGKKSPAKAIIYTWTRNNLVYKEGNVYVKGVAKEKKAKHEE